MAKEANKEKALIALLTTDTNKAAAEAAGISVETVYRFLRDPAFLSEYREARRSLMGAALGKIQKSSEQAAETLKRNLHCGSPNVEIAAARIILETAIKGVELIDVLERVEALEALTKGEK